MQHNKSSEDGIKIINKYGNIILFHALGFIMIMLVVFIAEYGESGSNVFVLLPLIFVIFGIGYGFKRRKLWAYYIFKSILYVMKLAYPVGNWMAKKALADLNNYRIRELMTWW